MDKKSLFIILLVLATVASLKDTKAFTYETNYGGYINYHVDEEKQNLQRIEPTSVNFDGKTYTVKDHGTIINNSDTEFIVSGVNASSQCPSGYIFTPESGSCTQKPLCDNETGKIKGIPGNGRYHDRKYVVCGEKQNYNIGECTMNTIYNQKESQDSTTNPCMHYDVCGDELFNYIHKYQISADYTLKNNQYYVCQNNKIVLKSCEGNMTYSSVYKTCVEVNMCVDHENATFPGDDNSFVSCRNDTEKIVNCPNGVYVQDSVHSCVNPLCLKKEITFVKYITMPNFMYPTTGMACVPTYLSCHDIQIKEFKLSEDPDYKYLFPKDKLIDDVHYPGSVPTLNEAGVLTCTKFTDITQTAGYATNRSIVGLYNWGLPNINVDILNGNCVDPLRYTKLFNGKIMDNELGKELELDPSILSFNSLDALQRVSPAYYVTSYMNKVDGYTYAFVIKMKKPTSEVTSGSGDAPKTRTKRSDPAEDSDHTGTSTDTGSDTGSCADLSSKPEIGSDTGSGAAPSSKLIINGQILSSKLECYNYITTIVHNGENVTINIPTDHVADDLIELKDGKLQSAYLPILKLPVPTDDTYTYHFVSNILLSDRDFSSKLLPYWLTLIKREFIDSVYGSYVVDYSDAIVSV